MSYQAPQITDAGLSIPSYDDIKQLLLDDYRSIYGQTVNLTPDTADYQWIAVVALALSDGMQGLQLAYLNHSPVFAIGAALDTLVKINGLTRKLATASLVQVTLTGTPGTVVNNGIVVDVNGVKWDLPTAVTIGATGTATATATCEQLGAVNALVGQVNQIFTTVAGWTSVTNLSAAVIGQPIETDAQLRGRQSISVELPSITLLSGTIAAIAATAGVSRYKVLENATGAVDIYGNPPHSITSVVEGGSDQDVALAIYNNRGIGPLTNSTATPGAVTVNITDPQTAIITPIGFCRPQYVPIYVIVNAHLLAGGTLATIADMQAALNTYLAGLQIGELVSYSALVAIAMSVNPDLKNPIVIVESLFLAATPAPVTSTDILLLFYQVAQAATITVNSV